MGSTRTRLVIYKAVFETLSHHRKHSATSDIADEILHEGDLRRNPPTKGIHALKKTKVSPWASDFTATISCQSDPCVSFSGI